MALPLPLPRQLPLPRTNPRALGRPSIERNQWPPATDRKHPLLLEAS